MQYLESSNSNQGGANNNNTTAPPVDALQVLATTASNAHRSINDQSSSTTTTSNQLQHSTSSASNMSIKSSSNTSEDDESKTSGTSGRSSKRKGKWALEEEEYATRFIHYFSSGLLALPEGKTLRASLADKLECDPMRITKKYAGASCLGNKISKLCDRPMFSPQDIEMARLEIARLERRFHMRIAQGAGVPLPKDSSDSVASMINTSPATSVEPSNDATIQHLNKTIANNGSFIPQVGASPSGVPLVHQMNNQVNALQPASMASYLATLANNAQLAAAATPGTSLQNVNVASLLAGVTQPQQQQVKQQTMQPAPAPTVVAPAPAATSGGVNIASLLPFLHGTSAPTPSLQQQQGGANNNNQLVSTLLLQISTQLQLLASISPDTMKQIQLQILMSSISPPAGGGGATNMNTTIPQQTVAAPQTIAQQAASAPAFQAPHAPGQDTTQQLLASLQQFTNASAGGQQQQHRVAGLPQATTTALPGLAPGLQSLLSSVTAQAPVPLATFSSTSNGVATNIIQTNNVVAAAPAPVAPTPSSPQVSASNQGHHAVKSSSSKRRKSSHHSQERKKKVQASTQQQQQQQPMMVPTKQSHDNNTMAEYLDKLRQGHAEALEKARREAAAQIATEGGSASKNQRQISSNSDGGLTSAILPFEHATTISSGSGCTTNDSSTSSEENLLASDETTRNDGSTSSNSMSDEDVADQERLSSSNSSSSKHRRDKRSSVPPRKRFRSSSDKKGCLSRRNLADHDVRMAEEMSRTSYDSK